MIEKISSIQPTVQRTVIDQIVEKLNEVIDEVNKKEPCQLCANEYHRKMFIG